MEPMESATFGERLLIARRRSGMKQKELAERIGVQPTEIYRLEKGLVSDPHMSRIVALSKTLNISTDWLLLGREHQEKNVEA